MKKSDFHGNIDAKLIREKVKKIGLFLVEAQHSGYDLLSIKNQRNSLAHGAISFCQCGRDLTVSEIIPMIARTKEYLEAFLNCFEEYISKQLYRKIPPKENVHAE